MALRLTASEVTIEVLSGVGSVDTILTSQRLLMPLFMFSAGETKNGGQLLQSLMSCVHMTE
jgi:hypothetical protein